MAVPHLFDCLVRVQFAFFGGQLRVQLRGLEIGARVGERGEGLSAYACVCVCVYVEGRGMEQKVTQVCVHRMKMGLDGI